MRSVSALFAADTLVTRCALGARLTLGGLVAGRDDEMTSGDVAHLYGVDRSTISRLSRDRLGYRLTPGGQRRYRRADVYRYGREYMGLELPDDEASASSAE
jgi:hypothetical protein